MPPRLETDRLVLRPFTERDAGPAYTLFETHPDVYRYDPGYARAYEQRAALIGRYALENDEEGLGTLAVQLKETGALIGYCGLQYYLLAREPYATPEVELFYKLGRTYWSCGYAAEACRALLGFAFTSLRLGCIRSCVQRDNARSIRLLERLGAQIEPAPPAWPDMLVGTIAAEKYRQE